EARQLRLEDVDWKQGRLLIRAGKTHRERCLPLTQEVGDAIADYLRRGRPASPHREIFLSLRSPHEPIRDSSAVSRIVRLSLQAAGISRQSRG
ncbi:tyrosine-type recombinase/integrase, partial [Picosynechococcus sp. PCC 7002]|uniref:tyrosine-type recombinase/integrase n=1 Tax=Picosynechococcus sp. (strain ATCC 27264 / PCC 7002 / PR-6) TaxID=32049 RepID=UPI001C3CA2F1